MNPYTKRKVIGLIASVVLIILIISILTPAFSAAKGVSRNKGFGYGYGENPRPSLSLDPDGAEGCDATYTIMVTNTGDEEDDDAENVILEITVVKGSEYVDNVEYDGLVGDIENEESVPFEFTILTNDDWDSAPDEEIKIKITVTNEDVWPSHNEGKKAHYTLLHCV